MTRRLLSLLLVAALSSASADEATVSGPAKVVDGDSLEIGATRIRLHAIDAPEALQRCGRGGASWPCGAAATAKLHELTGTAVIRCRRTATDDYGRMVAVCRNGSTDLAAELVEAGLARAYLRYGDDYARAEAAARSAKRGIWVSEHDAPWDFRRRGNTDGGSQRAARRGAQQDRPPAAPERRAGCLIKGNIGSGGERIYHVPGSPSYDDTSINRPGERWFCTEQEARDAGWRAPRR